jgi:lipopolysaccharide biosynthesis glycosyltransferase
MADDARAETARKNAVAFFADEAYFPPAFVAGMAAHTAVQQIADIYIFTNSKDLAKHYETHAKLKVRFLDIQSKIPGSVPVRPGASRMAFGRFFLADLLSNEYERVLYLDSDVAVESNLVEIFDLDLKGQPIGAVMDCTFIANQTGKAQQHWRTHMQTIGLPPDAPYFNSGAILIDLDKWRATEVPEKAVWFFANQAAPRSMDQDALNYIFFQKWIELHPKWNYQTLYLPYKLEDKIRPVIWHYVDTIKPWHDFLWRYDRSHIERYKAAFAETDWPDFIKSHRRVQHIGTRLNQKFKRLLLHFQRSKLHHEQEKRREQRRNAIAFLLGGVK